MSNSDAVIANGGAVRALADIVAEAHGFKVAPARLDETEAPEGLPHEVPIGFGPKGEPLNLRPFFEHWRVAPERKRGTARLLSLDSYIELTRRHATPDSVIFADTDWKKPSFVTVVDYHELEAGGAADFMVHRLTYAFPLSEEWKAWSEQNSKPMSQADFAAFVEDHIADLAAPTDDERAGAERDFAMTIATPSEVIQMSRGLAVQVESTVKTAVTLQTGEAQLVFEERHVGGDRSPLKVPGLVMLAVAPFFLGDKIRLPVRIRYRVREGKLIWSLAIFRPDQFVTEQIRADLEAVRVATGLPCFEGSPEAVAS